jgi:hypothetical protein
LFTGPVEKASLFIERRVPKPGKAQVPKPGGG